MVRTAQVYRRYVAVDSVAPDRTPSAFFRATMGVTTVTVSSIPRAFFACFFGPRDVVFDNWNVPFVFDRFCYDRSSQSISSVFLLLLALRNPIVINTTLCTVRWRRRRWSASPSLLNVSATFIVRVTKEPPGIVVALPPGKPMDSTSRGPLLYLT